MLNNHILPVCSCYRYKCISTEIFNKIRYNFFLKKKTPFVNNCEHNNLLKVTRLPVGFKSTSSDKTS